MAWTLVVLAATLWPSPASVEAGIQLDPLCLLCGDRGAADFVLNVGFFVPLGLALGGCRGPLAALVLGGLLSGTVEGLQALIPGRFSTLSDLVANSLGAGLGAGALRLALSGPRGRRAVEVAVAALGGAAALAPALLLAPSTPPPPYWGQHAPEVPVRPSYPGRVLEAHVGGRPAPRGRLASVEGVRASLMHRGPLDVSFVVAPPPGRFSLVFRLADARQRGLAEVGVAGEDLAVRFRTTAAHLRFEQPHHVWHGALAGYEASDTARVSVGRDEDDPLCIRLDGRSRCDLSPSPGDGWQLLLAAPRARPALRLAVGVGWLILLWLPLGWTARRRLAPAAVAALLLVGAGPLSPWIAVSGVASAAPTAGVAVGGAVRRRVEGREPG